MGKIYFCCFFFLIVNQSFAQKYKVAGVITDEAGKAVSGALVQEMGTNTSTLTNDLGLYEMSVSYTNATLVVDKEGFVKVEREIHGVGTQSFVLVSSGKPRAKALVGSKKIGGSVEESFSPVEIIDVKKLVAMNGQFDLTQLLHFASTSVNSNRQIGADGTDNANPVSIHGLGPDQMLLLVNGKRRHQSSMVNLSGVIGRGNTGADLNTIPLAAIDHIEILKDGAAALYGSDAVAGVINVVLKESITGFSVNANAGVRYVKYNRDSSFVDGLNYNANVNYGRRIGKRGFVNVTGDYNFLDHTNRSDTQIDSVLRQQYGDPRIFNGKIAFNAAVPINDKFEVYGFGGYNFSQTQSFAFSRTLKKSDSLSRIYPDGYDPLLSRNIEDRSATVGVRTKWKGFLVDFSNTYGYNKFRYQVDNTLNQSYGVGTATSMNAGGFRSIQNVTNLDLSRYYADAMAGVNFAFGVEYRMDWYKIFAGDVFSYRTYDPLKASGAQGFAGYSPADEINKHRYNAAGYVDVNANVTERFALNGSGRFDYYGDLGSAVSGKGGFRFKVIDGLTLRGTYGLGFKAPSLAQQYFSRTTINPASAVLVIPTQVIIARPGSTTSAALNIPDLKFENTQTATAGILYSPNRQLSVGIDGYYVKVKDRIILAGPFASSDRLVGSSLQKLNVAEARFFTNSLTTSTAGVDVTVKYTVPLAVGNLTIGLGGNYNTMSIDSIHTAENLPGKEAVYLDKRERYFILSAAPPMKGNLTLDYDTKRFSAMVRVVYFGEIELVNNYFNQLDKSGKVYTEKDFIDVYKPVMQTDVSVGYKFTDKIMATVGGSNILNVYPTMSKPYKTLSGGAWDSVQMGSNGAFFFAKLFYNF